MATPAQKTIKARAIGATALDAKHPHRSKVGGPIDKRGIAVDGRRDKALAETPAQSIERDSDVFVFVGVDSDYDVVTFECNALYVVDLLYRSTDCAATWRGGQDCDGTCAIRLL